MQDVQSAHQSPLRRIESDADTQRFDESAAVNPDNFAFEKKVFVTEPQLQRTAFAHGKLSNVARDEATISRHIDCFYQRRNGR